MGLPVQSKARVSTDLLTIGPAPANRHLRKRSATERILYRVCFVVRRLLIRPGRFAVPAREH